MVHEVVLVACTVPVGCAAVQVEQALVPDQDRDRVLVVVEVVIQVVDHSQEQVLGTAMPPQEMVEQAHTLPVQLVVDQPWQAGHPWVVQAVLVVVLEVVKIDGGLLHAPDAQRLKEYSNKQNGIKTSSTF
ncbi:hypothetical protein GCM10009621_09560 [Corynebacterium felinum]